MLPMEDALTISLFPGRYPVINHNVPRALWLGEVGSLMNAATTDPEHAETLAQLPPYPPIPKAHRRGSEASLAHR